MNLTKEEIEVLRAMTIEKDGKLFAQRNVLKAKKLMNKKMTTAGNKT